MKQVLIYKMEVGTLTDLTHLTPAEIRIISENKEYTASQCQKDVRMFWVRMQNNWKNIEKRILYGDYQTHAIVNGYLSSKLQEMVDIQISYGEINRQCREGSKGNVELFISPRLGIRNIPYMKYIYRRGLQYIGNFDNLFVSCYDGYYRKNPIFENIKVDGVDISYEDFGYNGTLDEIKDGGEIKTVLHVIILVNPKKSKYLLDEKEYNINGVEKKVLLPNEKGIINNILINILGEFHLMSHVGYIEFITDEEKFPNREFTELYDLRKDIEIISKNRNYRECAFCERKEYQADLVLQNNHWYCLNWCSSTVQLLEDTPNK
jgi:hypothetical protein